MWDTLHDDQKLFEFIVLDTFQSGLSWLTGLKKRENFRKSFDNFALSKIAEYGTEELNMLLLDKTIIRNRLKIEATINNAKAFIKIQEKYGSFDTYIWQFVDNKPLLNKFESIKDLPVKTSISDKMSKDLKQKGFKFVG